MATRDLLTISAPHRACQSRTAAAVGGSRPSWGRALLVGVLTALLVGQLLLLLVHYATGLYQFFSLGRTVQYLVDSKQIWYTPTLPGLLLSFGAGAAAGVAAWAAPRWALPTGRVAGLGVLGSVSGGLASLLVICCSPAMAVLIGSGIASVVLLAYQQWHLLVAAGLALQAASIVVVLRTMAPAGAAATAAPAADRARPVVPLLAANLVAFAAVVAVAASPPATPVRATSSGSMLVHVQDASGRLQPGAWVAVNGPTGVTRPASDGLLSLTSLAAGSYRVTAELRGATGEQRAEVSPGQTAHVFIVLGSRGSNP